MGVWKQQLYSHSVLHSFMYTSLCLLQVSSLFKDGTIGGNINIVIVGLVLLDEEQVSTSQPGKNFSFLRPLRYFLWARWHWLITGHVFPPTRFRRENCQDQWRNSVSMTEEWKQTGILSEYAWRAVSSFHQRPKPTDFTPSVEVILRRNVWNGNNVSAVLPRSNNLHRSFMFSLTSMSKQFETR